MGAQLLDLLFCVKCGYLFIRTAGRAKKGWTHHDGTRNARNAPNWCTCRTRETVPRKLHAAILGAEQVGGRVAAQSLLDQARGVRVKGDPDRLQVSKKNYQPLESAYSGIDRSVGPSVQAFGTLYGRSQDHMSRMIIDDPLMAETPMTEEKRQQIIDWFTKALPRTGGV